MLAALIPKERRFFELFNQHGDRSSKVRVTSSRC